ncbi:MAG TPA: response regulator [Thermoanaerobaculia bacterium]|nr:response regulator [Thermoanaerobaculia bacterium]
MIDTALGRILLIEDDAAVAAGLEALLESVGAEVHVCDAGLLAEAAVRSFEPDLVLIDIGLPDLDGREVARRVAAIRPGLPLILMSGHLRMFSDHQHPALGFLTKPFALEDLLELVRSLKKGEGNVNGR